MKDSVNGAHRSRPFAQLNVTPKVAIAVCIQSVQLGNSNWDWVTTDVTPTI